MRWKLITSWQSSSLAEHDGTSSGRHPSWSSRFTSAPRRSRHLAAERKYNITTTRYNARILPAQHKYNITTTRYNADTWQQNARTILQLQATMHRYYLLNVRTILQTTHYNARLLPARRTYNITNNTLQCTATNARLKYNITNNTLQRTAITC